MNLTQIIVRVAVTPFGALLDQFVVRWTGHSFVAWAFARANDVEYNDPLLLTTIGARTGRKRNAVLPHFRAGPHRAVVGSKGGMRTDPHWVHNVRANPDVWIRVDRRFTRARARIAEGPEREKLWGEITARAPVYVEYQERCAAFREIPVVVIEEVEE